MSETPTPLIAPDGRSFQRAVSVGQWRELFGGATFRTKYRGVRMLKNAFDLVIHLQLLGDLKPQSVIEIGSKFGGSALWFSDMIRAQGGAGRVVSVDINPPKLDGGPHIQYLQGDACRLGDVLSEDLLAQLPRPWFISEDSAHLYETTKGVLDFFGPRLAAGEMICVEDGAVGDGGPAAQEKYANGPNRAVCDFLNENIGRYEIAANYCDFFGYNITGNPNGYLRRI